ncbi:dormancy/auxin associated protein [Populus alba x Populus x berolinensis]|uniref:Dormancy/auxin associated protein n=2 Tax=Populus TaxID=3689 RepID=A0AAD6LVX1_9ROSI|nr:dormancy/auxin associated protein [Populus alba x Populus x berolinensis]
MSLLDHLWDDTVAGPLPDNGLGKLRKKPSYGLRPNSGKESDGSGGSVMRSYGGEATTEETKKVTRSIMIVRPPGYQNNGSSSTPPASPAGSTPPVSPFSGFGWHITSRLCVMDNGRKQRVLSVSKKVYVGCIREDNRGWTQNSYFSLRRMIYEPSTSSPASLSIFSPLYVLFVWVCSEVVYPSACFCVVDKTAAFQMLMASETGRKL